MQLNLPMDKLAHKKLIDTRFVKHTAIEESIGNVKIFQFRLLLDLHVLGCSEHDFNIYTKCLSVCV